MTQRLARITRDERAVAALSRCLLSRFGGLENLASEVRGLVEESRQAGRFDIALSAMMAVINLLRAAERLE
jgi:hypothetical protein